MSSHIRTLRINVQCRSMCDQISDIDSRFSNVKFPIFVRMAAKQGWVTVLGVICPFLYTTFRLKRVNDGSM